jgi:hypothetical protein
MSKYLKTKKGSLESAVLEAMSPAQQAAIAISKKEKEKEKSENNYIHAAKMAKEKGEKTFTIGGKQYDVEETLKTEKLVGGQKKLDKDKDGDIDGKDFAAMRKAKKEEMDPTDHVKKKGDKYCVYNADGSIAKEFDNKEDADKYAIDNHDKIMATAKKEEVELDEGYSAKQIKMAIGIASDKRYAGGNYSGAVKAIEKIKKGLSDHKQVAAVLKRQNESLAQQAARHITNMWQEAAKKAENAKPSKLMGTKEAMCEDCGKEPCVCKSEDDKQSMTGKPMAKVEVSPKESKAK